MVSCLAPALPELKGCQLRADPSRECSTCVHDLNRCSPAGTPSKASACCLPSLWTALGISASSEPHSGAGEAQVLSPGPPVSPNFLVSSPPLCCSGAALPLTHHPNLAAVPSGSLALEQNEFPTGLGFFTQISLLLPVLKVTWPCLSFRETSFGGP